MSASAELLVGTYKQSNGCWTYQLAFNAVPVVAPSFEYKYQGVVIIIFRTIVYVLDNIAI